MYSTIVKKGLWQDIKEQEKAVRNPYYKTGFGAQFIGDEGKIKCYYLDKCYLNKVIETEGVNNICKNSSVFIISQTGTGKTTFIFDSCLPSANAINKKVLYLCNRTELEDQVKKRAIKCNSNKNSKGDEFLVKDYNQNYTKEGLHGIINFGNIDICTYQKFLNIVNKFKESNYAYVIMDEAHFFTSDATFNQFTEQILDLIIQKFKNCRRIYLSATPEECVDLIWQKEKMYTNMTFLVMQEDYKHINPFFFQNEDLLIDIIKKSEEDQYWLIFINNKNKGKDLLNRLQKLSPEFFTAESEKDSKLYNNLINNERLDSRILITTKVLDVGINIKNDNINIVVFEQNIPEIKQMIGRKRVKSNEKINVYFFVPTINELKRSLTNTSNQISEFNSIVNNTLNSNSLSKLEHPMFMYNNKLLINSFCKSKLQIDRNYQETLINFLDEKGDKEMNYNNEQYMTNFAKFILEYFPNCNFSKVNILDASFDNEVDKIIRKYKTMDTINKKTLKMLSREIIGCIGDIRKKPRDSDMSIGSLNKALSKYGYAIESFGTPREYRIEGVENA